MLDWENEVLVRRQKAGRGNLADDSATNAAIEAASIKKLTFKADSLQRVRESQLMTPNYVSQKIVVSPRETPKQLYSLNQMTPKYIFKKKKKDLS